MIRTPLLVALVACLPACGGGSNAASPAPPPPPDPIPVVTFDDPASIAFEGTAAMPVRIVMNQASTNPVTVPILVHPASEAMAILDFNLVQLAATFPPGATEFVLEVDVLDDGACEGPELLRLVLGVPANATLGFQDTHDLTIAGSEFELEPNDTEGQALANGPTAVLSAVPAVVATLCGSIEPQGSTDANDVFQFDTTDDVRVEVTLTPDDPGADVTLVITSIPNAPLLFVNDAGPGGAEVVAFDWPPGTDLGVIVSALATTAGSAGYQLDVTAMPVPPVPLPEPFATTPRKLVLRPEIARLRAEGADLATMIARLRELSSTP